MLYRARGGQDLIAFSAKWIVNCTGMERAGIGHSPLLGTMCDLGIITMDDLGLGISVDSRSRALDPAGKPRSGLFAAGALTAGQFWEITAVPDIRVQAKNIADAIVHEVRLAVPVPARIA